MEAHRTNTLVLTGLDGSNPLAFLVLRAHPWR